MNLLLALLNVGNANFFGTADEVEEVAEKARQLYNPAAPVEYGADVSFPMHYARVSDNYPWLEHNIDLSKPIPKEYREKPIQPLGNRQQFYEDFMQGCREHYGKSGRACDSTEDARVSMSLRQPQSMVVCILCFDIDVNGHLFECTGPVFYCFVVFGLKSLV